MKAAALLAALFATVAAGCTPPVPSSLLGVERRDGRYAILAHQCSSERIERIGIGTGVDLEGEYEAELVPGSLEKRGDLYVFGLSGLAPPGSSREAPPEFPLHVWVQFDDGATYTFASRAPSESKVLYHERADDGLFVEVESTPEVFLQQASSRCEDLES